MKIKPKDRKKVNFYLKNFYKYFPDETYTVFHFVRYLKTRLRNNKDAWFGVCGDTGTGKSLAVLMIQILFGRPFSLVDNVTYIPKGNEIMEKFRKLKFSTLLIDEAAKQMRAVQWQDKQQQKVNVGAMTERFKNNAIFMNLPNFAEFTKSMRLGSIQFRIIIPYRTKLFARVIIQRKSRNWRSSDPWGDETADKIYQSFEKKGKEITNEMILNIERSLPTTIMDFIVPNLELIVPNVTNEYERLKLESRNIDIEEESKANPKTNIFKTKYEKLLIKITKILYNNELDIGLTKVTKQDISNSLGIGMPTLNKYLKLDIRDYDKKPTFRKAQN